MCICVMLLLLQTGWVRKGSQNKEASDKKHKHKYKNTKYGLKDILSILQTAEELESR